MIIAPERFASRRDTLAFVLCVLLSISARLAPVQVQQAIASAITDTIGLPFLAIQRQAVLMRTARARVAAITAQRDSASLDSLSIYVLSEENQRLRELLELSYRLPVEHVAAEVLHQASPADEFTLLLSAGRNRGVREMAPVVAPDGLVGIVRSVGARASVAVVWTHPDFRASAMTADGGAFGIVAPRGSEGPNAMLLELRGVPFREDVPIGTPLYTSGRGSRLGGAFPRGIPIGTVVAVGEQREGWSSSYVVRPAVQPGSVSHLIILTGTGDDVGTGFDSPP